MSLENCWLIQLLPCVFVKILKKKRLVSELPPKTFWQKLPNLSFLHRILFYPDLLSVAISPTMQKIYPLSKTLIFRWSLITDLWFLIDQWSMIWPVIWSLSTDLWFSHCFMIQSLITDLWFNYGLLIDGLIIDHWIMIQSLTADLWYDHWSVIYDNMITITDRYLDHILWFTIPH